ncbi:signal transduction histidine kinase regulating C4-dicarboxylate transport system [Vibrio ichthyoenteri ATCC 700023]|uniref:C4-dicarboxylate transport sensor protein DctB n=1 Tax=Vibrio ichthyoenteri ATCC 700023 TaxID=870968 RepID=F9RZB9_9VIBR|nr:signal transduction histidine kinase regulating C4-dicarboxylate transport system [Vibrio ichthyoenteri ATCC 700023]
MAIRRVNLYILVLYFLCLVLGGRWIWNLNYQAQLAQHQAQLDRFASHINTKLDKYTHLPQLLAQDTEIISALMRPDNSAQIDITNRYLAQVNTVISAADSYLLDAQGTTLAASNWNLSHSFVGRNFAWRPYFSQAIQGNRSEYFALGSTSGQRGYYYSYPVVYAAEIIGVIVIKMDLTAIEANWNSEQNYFVATDRDQVIFMSSNPSWLFHSLSDIAPPTRQQILQSRRYLDSDLPSLGLSGDFALGHSELYDAAKGGGQGDYIVSSRQLDDVELKIRVLTPKRTVLWSTLSFLLILTLLFTIALLSLQLVHQQQQRKRQFEQLQLEAKQKLEFLVMERTAELHAENHEREKTEQALRQTQNELIQAAKLAVLGQMSASISHELNNPLAAIRSFSDNGQRFLAKQQYERVEENLRRISALTVRMAKISEQLKSFARKSDSGERQMLSLTPLIEAALALIHPQLKANQVMVDVQLSAHPIHVEVNPIQLEQVLINLLSNAIQAIESLAERNIALSIETLNDLVLIHIDDNGDGIDEQIKNRLFEPFYTTKKMGLVWACLSHNKLCMPWRGISQPHLPLSVVHVLP